MWERYGEELTLAVENGPADDRPNELLGAVLKAVVEAYYPDRVRSGAVARSRAQAAQSIVTIFAGGVVGTVTVTTLSTAPNWVRVAGIAAVVLWFLAALGYVTAVAKPTPPPPGPSEAEDASSLIKAVLNRAAEEAKTIDRRQQAAQTLVVAAVIATTVAFGFGLFVERSKFVSGKVQVGGPPASLQAACVGSASVIEGEIDLSTLGEQFVVVRVKCGTADRQALLRIPRSDVKSIQTAKEDE
jgi:MFS family permease